MISLKKEINSLIAEAVGTFALVLFGCGAIIVNELYNNPLGHLGICLVFGVVVMAMIYSVGNISGTHLNPAVSIGFFFARRIGLQKALLYIVFQLAGAFLAAFLLRVAFPESESLGATLPSVSWIFAAVIEIILSFILMFVILNVSTGHREKGIMAGVAIGGVIFMEALVGGPLTGASMNPARSLAPALLSLKLDSVWIYLVAPVIGTVLASPFCRLIQGDQCCYEKD